ncbi:MAG TPA: tetratricopeptide repeat protein [Candidatus Polarisedimenticolia bacterium]|nr:tetratricopeptide repeat protein [Candidatus Polarisedimenticolia bacterium]
MLKRCSSVLGIATILAVILPGACHAATPQRVLLTPPVIPLNLELLARSTDAQERGDMEEAQRWAEELVTLDPGSSFAAWRLAQILESAGEDVRALAWGNRALALDSLNADAAMLVGRMRLRAGEAAIAAKALTPPLRLLGARPELYALRALAHELDKNYEAALADLRRTGELLPDFGWVATGVLAMALEDGRLDEARKALELALSLQPDDPRTLGLGVELARRLGDSALEEKLLRRRAEGPDALPEQVAAYASYLFRMGDRKATDAFLVRMAKKGFDPIDTRVNAARFLLREGAYRPALMAMKPIQDLPAALPVQGRALAALSQEKPALACYRKLRALRTLTQDESLLVAYLEIKAGDRKVGLRTLEGVREALFQSPRRILAGALCYMLLRHPEEAVALMREGAARGTENPMLYAELGQTAVSIGDSLVAEWAFQKLNGLGRENSECLTFLAASDLNQGAQDRALRKLDRAVELDPRNGRALALLGTLRYNMGQLELARDLLRRAVLCPETGADAERTLGRVCRALRLDDEARAAESRAREKRPPTSPAGLTLFSRP